MIENLDDEFDGSGDDKASQSSSHGSDDSTQQPDKWQDLSPEMSSALASWASRFRLVEVQASGGASSHTNLVARLCEAEDYSENASYLTLSHCWGGHASLQLTKSNLEALREDIPIHELPALFKDALYMTAQLGVKYIWIDCLCILQDCRDDWEFEAARMGDVYQYARCGIAASGYRDGKTSLFKKRIPIPLLNFPLCMDRTLVANNVTAKYPERMPINGLFVRSDTHEFDDAVTKGPLNSRGWVAQERALSPGILHFTPKQMWWECKNHIFSESFSYGDFFRDFERSSNPLHMDTAFGQQEDYITWKWGKFVAFYAGTNLTVWSDRFPALRGIACQFATITGDNIIAGFWERDIIRSLAWR
ncbi:heterokaryon incompatibility protein, partial [Diaporthe helianthi]